MKTVTNSCFHSYWYLIQLHPILLLVHLLLPMNNTVITIFQ